MAANGPPGRRVAVLIGQNRFPQADLQDLRFAEADIDALARLLQSGPGTPYDEVRCLRSGPHHTAFGELDAVASSLKHDDTLLVYYSGHGLVDSHGRLHLAFENTADDRLASSALKVSAVLDLLQTARARRRVLVLDCCYAGAVGAEFNRSGVKDQMQAEVSGSGTVVLTAATKLQVAKEKPEYGHGIFTKHVIDGLAGAADRDGDGIVSAQELYRYVHTHVTAEAAQKPQHFNHETEGQIVLRQTGLTPWKDRADSIRKTLFALASEGLISDRLLREALEVIVEQPARMSVTQRARFDALAGIELDDFRPGPFSDQWHSLRPEPPQPAPPKPEPPAKPSRVPAKIEVKPRADTAKSAPPGPDHQPGDIAARLDRTLWQRYWDFNRPGSQVVAPEWYANLTLVLYMIGPILYLFIQAILGIGTSIGAFGTGTVSLILGLTGFYLSRSRFAGRAPWRVIAFKIVAWIYLLLPVLLIIVTIFAFGF